jgi:ubiquinone biosynthesis protein
MSPDFNPALLEQMLAILPPAEADRLVAIAMQEGVSGEALTAAAQTALAGVDWPGQRAQLAALINQIMPLEQLVPEIYRAWRPVVADAVGFVGAHLSPARLGPKLIEQLMLPADLPLEERLLVLISRMPSLQKIGQIVARNRNLDPNFRARLIRLENSIHDITAEEISAEIRRQLGPILLDYGVELEDTLIAEASVSAVIGFTWREPAGGRPETGVFKVLKPYVSAYFAEELELLQGLADFFDAHGHNYPLAEVNLGQIFRDIRNLFGQEIDFPGEQANLQAADRRYGEIAGVRTPRLILPLCTPTITAMSREQGRKVTEMTAGSPLRRAEIAARIVEAVLAVPLFAPASESIFHADPHAGNLFVDEQSREVILFDWAMVDRLSQAERRHIILLMLALLLRDEPQMYRAVAGLTQDDLAANPAKARLVRAQIKQFIDQLLPLTVPGLGHVLTLLDSIVLNGVNFRPSLLMFRKVLFTLDGVLQDVAPALPVEPILAWYLLKQGRPGLGLGGAGSARDGRCLPLSTFDKLSLAWSAQWFAPRLGLQTGRQLRQASLRGLRRWFKS